jgi:hypothetical protein
VGYMEEGLSMNTLLIFAKGRCFDAEESGAYSGIFGRTVRTSTFLPCGVRSSGVAQQTYR